MTFFNISSQGDLLTTTDHLANEIAVYFVSPGQRCMGHHVEDHSTNHRGWAHGYWLRRNLTWWFNLYHRSHAPSAAVPTGTSQSWVTCGIIYEWEGRQKIKQAHHTSVPSDCGQTTAKKSRYFHMIKSMLIWIDHVLSFRFITVIDNIAALMTNNVRHSPSK